MSTKNKKTPANSGGLRTARFLLWGTFIILIIGFVAFAPMVFSGAKKTAAIIIPKNASEKNVADSLTKYFGQSYSDHTMHLLNLRKVDFKKRYGRYEIAEGTSPFNAMRKLGSGGQSPVTLTINGFRSLPMLVQRVSAKLNFEPKDLMDTLNDSTLMAKYGLTTEQAMSLFIDDSYEVYWTSTPQQLIEKIGNAYNTLWNTSRRKRAANLGLTPAEVITICSIVDEETNSIEEKGAVGRLYLNRLAAGMKLQADPTVRYALHDFTIRRVMEKHLNIDSPYNTYKYDGLPPGPIRTTSKATIDALLDSSPSNYLYMCAKEDFSGQHNFAATYEEHVANALRYQNALDRKGIK